VRGCTSVVSSTASPAASSDKGEGGRRRAGGGSRRRPELGFGGWGKVESVEHRGLFSSVFLPSLIGHGGEQRGRTAELLSDGARRHRGVSLGRSTAKKSESTVVLW
jgi:hypothetical protein